jgi:SAM-dependent methyltransferase
MQMDAHHLTFEDASFDTVTISNSIHHMSDPKQVLAEMARVLKPGGHVIISEMVHDNLTEEQQTHALIHHWWAEIDLALGIPHYETYTRQQLIDLANGIGLSRCDLYDYADLTSDPHDAEQTEYLRGHLRRYLDRAKDLPNFADIEARGLVIDRRLDDVGFRGATLLVVIGQS